jgi:hypothetical protein
MHDRDADSLLRAITSLHLCRKCFVGNLEMISIWGAM